MAKAKPPLKCEVKTTVLGSVMRCGLLRGHRGPHICRCGCGYHWGAPVPKEDD